MANKLPSVENIKETVYSYLDDYDDFSIEGVDMNDRDQFDEYFLNQVCLDLIDDYAPELDAYSEEWDEYYKEVEKEVVKYLKSKGINTFDFGESVKFKKGQPLSEGTSNFSSPDNFPLLVFYTYDEVYDLLSDDSNYPDEDDFTDEEGEVDWDAYEDAKETFEEKFFDELDACVLTEEDVENLEEDIDNFNGDTKSIAYEIYDKDYEDADDDYYTLKDIAVKIESGYYAAAQIDVENEDEFQYLSEKLKNEQLERFKNFFKELKDKYNLTELTVAYRFSNGETGYNKVESLTEGLKESKEPLYRVVKNGQGKYFILKRVNDGSTFKNDHSKETFNTPEEAEKAMKDPSKLSFHFDDIKETFDKETATLLDLFKNKNKYIVEEKLNEDFYLYIEALTENGEAIYQDRFNANNIKNVLVEICDAETGSYTGESVYPVAITDKLSDVRKEALEELGIESKNEAIEGTPKESDYKKNAKKHKASNKKGARGNNDGFGRAVNTNPQRNQEIFNHMMGTDGGAEGASCEGGACGESLEEAYIYLFPDAPAMGDYKNECKKFGLKFLGKNYFEDEENLVIKGSKANLKKYADFLDYDLHPDYLYDENDFAGDIEESCKSKKLKEEYLDDDYKAIADGLWSGWYHGTTYDGRKWGLSINGGDGEQFSPLFADALANEIAYCVEDGNLSFDGLECNLYLSDLEGISEEQLAKDLETVDVSIDDWTDKDEAITFYIDYEIDLDEYEDDLDESIANMIRDEEETKKWAKKSKKKIKIVYGNSWKEAESNEPIEVTQKQLKQYQDAYSYVRIIDESLKEEHIVKPDAVFFDENNTAFWNGCKIEREKIEDEDDDDYWDYKVYDKAGVFKYSSDDLEKAINYINKWEESLEKGKKVNETFYWNDKDFKEKGWFKVDTKNYDISDEEWNKLKDYLKTNKIKNDISGDTLYFFINANEGNKLFDNTFIKRNSLKRATKSDISNNSLEESKINETRDENRVAQYQEELDELGATEEECNKYIKIADDYEAKCDRHFITYDQMKEVADAMGLKEMSDKELARAWKVCYYTLSREAFKEDDSEDLERYHKYSDASSAFAEVINQEARERKAKGNYSPRKGESLNLESIIGDDFFVDNEGLAYISEKKIKEIIANAKDVGMSFDELMNQTFSGEKDGRYGSLRLSEYKGTFKKFWDNNESLKEEVLKEDIKSDELKKYIANEGITLDASTSEPVEYDKGYEVSFAGTEERIPKDKEDEILNALNKKINDKEHPFVGLWIENDEACLDYSEYIEDFEEALKRAKERNQVAIYDWSIKDSIYLKDIVK